MPIGISVIHSLMIAAVFVHDYTEFADHPR